MWISTNEDYTKKVLDDKLSIQRNPRAEELKVWLRLFFSPQFRFKVAERSAMLRFDTPLLNLALRSVNPTNAVTLDFTDLCFFGYDAGGGKLTVLTLMRHMDWVEMDASNGQRVVVNKQMNAGKWIRFALGWATYEEWRSWFLLHYDLSHLCDNHTCINPHHHTTEINTVNTSRTKCFRLAFDMHGDRRCDNSLH